MCLLVYVGKGTKKLFFLRVVGFVDWLLYSIFVSNQLKYGHVSVKP